MNKVRNYGKESENMDDVSPREKRNKYDDLHSEFSFPLTFPSQR